MPDEPFVSVIIPVWRDEEMLARTLRHLQASRQVEVLVACVLGDEARYDDLRRCYPAVRWVSAPRGRAIQMNAGAAVARGRWVLFLHADSELPSDWLEVLTQAEERADSVAGSFRLALASRDWRARVIETGVRLRLALFGLPYGDQALFVKRRVFDRLRGYRDLPLMEDVDLVHRIKGIGRFGYSPSPVVTSARRWQAEGWFRRSAQNLWLSTQFFLGASPARLARTYFGRKRRAVVMMARAPWSDGKTRLRVTGGDTAHAALRQALFLDTLDVVRSLGHAEHVVACEPAAACERMRELAGTTVDVIAQRGGDLGARLAHVFEDVFRLGVESAVVIGSDLPDLPRRLLDEALAALHGRDDRVVLGPAADGGYYLIGMNRLHPALFERIDWSTGEVLAQTMAAARAAHLETVVLDTWKDIDHPADLDRLLRRASGLTARRTRAWAARSGVEPA